LADNLDEEPGLINMGKILTRSAVTKTLLAGILDKYHSFDTDKMMFLNEK
jgi:hypothetical protein